MRVFSLVMILTLSAGCVAKSQYLELQAENDRLQQRVDRLDARLERQQAQAKELMEDLKPLIDRGVLKVEVVKGRVSIAVASDVLFASGSAELTESARRDVAEVSRALSRRAAEHHFQVEGHTDSEPIRTAQFPNNWYLGAARAIAVAEQMIASGFPRDHLSAASFADTQPVGSNSSESGRRLNRRIEIVLLPDLQESGQSRSKSPPARPPRR